MRCHGCGQAFDDAPPAEGGSPDAVPETGSLALHSESIQEPPPAGTGRPIHARSAHTARRAKHGHAVLIAAGLGMLGAWAYTVQCDKPSLPDKPQQAFAQTNMDAAPGIGHSLGREGVSTLGNPPVASEPSALDLTPVMQATVPQRPAHAQIDLVGTGARTDCAKIPSNRQAVVSRGANRSAPRRAGVRPAATAGGATAAISPLMAAERIAPATKAIERKTLSEDSLAPSPLPKTETDAVPWTPPRLYEGRSRALDPSSFAQSSSIS